MDGWRGVTDRVHAEGGTIFAQIWHVGRMSHTVLQPDGKAPVSATGKPARDKNSMAFAFDESGKPGFVQTSVPRALETEDVRRVVNDFANAAAYAIRAPAVSSADDQMRPDSRKAAVAAIVPLLDRPYYETFPEHLNNAIGDKPDAPGATDIRMHDQEERSDQRNAY